MNTILSLLFLLQIVQAAIISPIQGITGGEIDGSIQTPHAIKPISAVVGGGSAIRDQTVSISPSLVTSATATIVSAAPTTTVNPTPIAYENASSTVKYAFNNDFLIVSSVVSALFLI
ncbi:hypothetical protein CANINC_004910 [Pichia inconspicua]|uniref:Uncharacterized protein n=1 Tax=Pichia inconspicua TaxID=52247 RepID=A0A4T0WUT0_9ASCO|nr:hypothetical protein CANINC_004910 [[Candida] inconspicua]